MDRFARWVISFRVPIIVVTVLLTLAAAAAIVEWSYIESDITKYLPEDDPVVIRFNEAGERFGGAAVGMVGVEFDDVFQLESLREIDRLTRAIGQIEGVSWVVSLTDMDDVQGEVIEGERAVAVSKVVDPLALPATPEALEALRRYVLGKEQLVGVVVSRDAKLANLAFNIQKDADRAVVASAVERAVREQAPGRKLYFGGFPYWMTAMSDVILRDMVYLVPIVTLVVIFILFVSFRSVRGVLLPMMTVAISSTWAMGLMATLGIPITMLSNVIPVLLIALGTAYAIHLLHKVGEQVARAAGERDLILRRAMADVLIPICLAGITTVIGFLSFLTSNLVFIQHFGLMAAFGIFAAMIVAMTTLPAILSLLRPAGAAREQAPREGNSVWLERLGGFVLGHTKLVTGVALILTLGSAAFIPQLDRQFNMVGYFPLDSEVRQADDMMREKLGGNVPIWLTFEGDPKGPFVLAQMWTCEKFLRVFDDVSNTRSVAGLIAQMNQVMRDHLSVPETAEGIGNLWFNLEGKDVLAQFVDKESKHALVQAVSTSSDTARLRVIVSEIEDFLAQLPSRGRLVDLRELDDAQEAAVRDTQVDRVALDLALDLRFRLGDPSIDRSQVAAWLREGLAAGGQGPDAVALAARLRQFMLSDESDLEFEDQALAGTLAEKLGRLAASEGLTREGITGLLKTDLPAAMVEEDPEGIGYLAKSLHLLIREQLTAGRVSQLVEHLLSRLPEAARRDEKLREELDGDLWPLTFREVWVPEKGDQPAGKSASFEVHQTGMHYVSVNVDERLVFSQLSSLGLAGLMAMLLLMIQFRSFLAGILGMIPMVITLTINFGVMGAFGIDLETSTVLIASLVVGVGIDYTIHFLSRTRLEMRLRGELSPSLTATCRTAGRAILINAITVTAGQLVFLAGELRPLHYFGTLLAIAMVTSALAAVTVMPAVLYLSSPRFLTGLRDSGGAEGGV